MHEYVVQTRGGGKVTVRAETHWQALEVRMTDLRASLDTRVKQTPMMPWQYRRALNDGEGVEAVHSSRCPCVGRPRMDSSELFS